MADSAGSDVEVGLLDESRTTNESNDDSSATSEGSDRSGERKRHCEDTCGGCFHMIFHCLCFLSGQLMIDCKRYNLSWGKCCFKSVVLILSFFLFILFLCLNLSSLAFDFYAVFWCPFPNCGFVAGPYIPYNAVVYNLTVEQKPSSEKTYFSYQDAVITVATISGSISYLIMIFRVLIVNYSCIHKPLQSLFTSCIASVITKLKFETITAEEYQRECEEKSNILLINPFFNGKHNSKDFKPAILHAKQLLCFYAVFFTNLLLYAGNVGTLLAIVVIEINKKTIKWESIYYIDYIGLSAQLASQYCAIISCFLFSKVAYAVTLHCHNQLEKYQRIIDQNLPENETLRRLEEMDTEYVDLCNESMKPYRFWFAVHWFMYAITAFMSVAYLVDTVIEYKQHFTQNYHYLIILYVLLFTLEHTVLFMYPCFRAASILEARNTLIYRVTKQQWPPVIKSRFLQFMKEQRCGFVLSLLCVRIEFGFNIAYISIFIGIIGIVVRVISVT